MRSRRPVVVVVAVVVAVLASLLFGGCGRRRVEENPATSSAPLVTSSSFEVAGRETLSGQLSANRVVWAGGDRPEAIDRIYLRDLVTGKTSVVARAPRGGYTDWVRISGDWVVYMELAAAPTDERPTPEWTIRAVDVRSGRSVVVDRGRGDRPGFNPSPQIDRGVVVWLRPTDDYVVRGDLVVRSLDGRGAGEQVLVRDVEATDYGITGGTVVYVAPSDAGRDVFAVGIDVDGSAPVRLTTSGRVVRANVGDGAVAYEEGPPDGDPERLLTMPVGGGSPTVVATAAPGEIPPSNPTPGDGVTAWFASDTVFVAANAADAPERAVTMQPDHASIQLRLDWDGRRLLWGEQRIVGGTFQNRFHVRAFG